MSPKCQTSKDTHPKRGLRPRPFIFSEARSEHEHERAEQHDVDVIAFVSHAPRSEKPGGDDDVAGGNQRRGPRSDGAREKIDRRRECCVDQGSSRGEAHHGLPAHPRQCGGEVRLDASDIRPVVEKDRVVSSLHDVERHQPLSRGIGAEQAVRAPKKGEATTERRDRETERYPVVACEARKPSRQKCDYKERCGQNRWCRCEKEVVVMIEPGEAQPQVGDECCGGEDYRSHPDAREDSRLGSGSCAHATQTKSRTSSNPAAVSSSRISSRAGR